MFFFSLSLLLETSGKPKALFFTFWTSLTGGGSQKKSVFFFLTPSPSDPSKPIFLDFHVVAFELPTTKLINWLSVKYLSSQTCNLQNEMQEPGGGWLQVLYKRHPKM